MVQGTSVKANSIAKHLNAEGGTSAALDNLSPEEDASHDSETHPFARETAAAVRIQGGPSAKTEKFLDDGREIQVDGPRIPLLSITLDVAAISAMARLRPSFVSKIEKERKRLQVVRDGLREPVEQIRLRLIEQRETLPLLEKEVVEKSRNHDKIAGQFRRAREVLKSTKVDRGATATKETRSLPNPPNRMCEQLVDSWLENVAVAYSQLETSEGNLKTQKNRVAETSEELTAAEDILKEKLEMLDMMLKQLDSLAAVLHGL